MLRNFENEAVAVVVGFQRVQDLRELAFFECDVDDGADDLRHAADSTRSRNDCLGGSCLLRSSRLLRRCGFFRVAALAIILTLFS